jgi:membrane dipeptidase
MTLVDGLVFRGDGWNDLVAASGLHAYHVTAGDFLSDHETVVGQIKEWRARILDAPRLFGVRDPADLDRIGEGERVGVVLGLQNAEMLAGRLDRLEGLRELGIRILQLTYNDANSLADGCLEPRDAGLTRFGREVVLECNRLGIVVDLSHVGRRSTLEAAEIATAPVVSSHANRLALSPCPRNKTDEELLAIAATGGVAGVSPYGPMCWSGTGSRPTEQHFVEQVLGMLELLGEDAVTIGTDFSAVAGETEDIGEVLERSLARYPEIFAPYVGAFGGRLNARYCAGLESLEAWTRIPSLLADAGVPDRVLAKVLGETWIDLYRRVWSRADEVEPVGAGAA